MVPTEDILPSPCLAGPPYRRFLIAPFFELNGTIVGPFFLRFVGPVFAGALGRWRQLQPGCAHGHLRYFIILRALSPMCGRPKSLRTCSTPASKDTTSPPSSLHPNYRRTSRRGWGSIISCFPSRILFLFLSSPQPPSQASSRRPPSEMPWELSKVGSGTVFPSTDLESTCLLLESPPLNPALAEAASGGGRSAKVTAPDFTEPHLGT